MRSAVIFLAGMYLHLVLSVLIPVQAILSAAFFWTDTLAILFDFMILFYLFAVGIVHVLGWISAGFALWAYRRREYDKLRQGWKLLKIWSIPFYLVNFAYSFIVWGVLVGASRGLMLVFVPVPIFLTCSMVVQSGVYGICWILYLRKQPDPAKKPSVVHYGLQVITVLDIISTIVLLRKYPRET